ncbi:aconitase family protein [Actinomarinicola tropica]|uniref:3-isopropylmalate dehydratase n=1 Tax=Actinomarinicola tropica TaxID=2789776 RepID=A0A5Q2RA55_9ACTN|nr:aconitase family protein [Actinomarinicola tropica]QGG93759.1 3-isopropylmalate dehydratase large subunit [Actinomarinicola tropica]
MGPRTIVEKIWDAHRASGEGTAIVADRVMIHERQLGTLGRMAASGVPVPGAAQVVACADQQMPTGGSGPDGDAGVGLDLDTGEIPAADAQVLAALDRLEASSELIDVPVFGPGDHRGGVMNVVAPEQGMTLPGALVVGADRHMSTHGAFGAIGLALDDAELTAYLADGTIDRPRPRVVRVTVAGQLGSLAGAKDLALWVLARLGPTTAAGAVVEIGGPTVRRLDVDARMTLCNLLVESGALTAVVEPDDTTFAYLEGRPFAPSGSEWHRAVAGWRQLRTDPGAELDAELGLVAPDVEPHASWGTAAWQATTLAGRVPAPDPDDPVRRAADERALVDQQLEPGSPLADISVDHVFVGSCANGRLDDIRAVAELLRGRRVAVPTWVVPGSRTVARQAEAEGLHRAIRDAGAEWRSAGCSLCIGVNGDAVARGARLASTANRPERGLVGPGARVHVLGPAAAAASALTGHLTDPRSLR